MRYSIPGLFPSGVVEVHDSAVLKEQRPDSAIVNRMIEKGITNLTGKDLNISFNQYSTESVYTFGEGNILRLGGGVFGVAADYIDSQVQRTALINIQFLKDSCK